MKNVLNIVFGGSRNVTTAPLWQYDTGQVAKFYGVDLPANYEVHFSNSSVGGTAVTRFGDKNGVEIPDSVLTSGEPVYAWLYLHEGVYDGETEYSAVIPVKSRPARDGSDPTPEEADAIAKALEALSEATDETYGAAALATAAASAASAAAESASDAAGNASVAADAATAATAAANTAAGYANAQGSYANGRGTFAQGQGDYAKEQGDYAKEQGDYAKEQGDAAKGAAATATTAAALADEKAAYAQGRGDFANQMGQYASAKGAEATLAAHDATTAATTARDAAHAANDAAGAATGAAQNANAAADAAKQALQLVTRYGVKFEGSANTGATVKRLYNAVGLVAGVGTDVATAVNDFDNVYPWSHIRRACGYWGDDGNFVVNAYKGEPGYAADGSNGEVWVEIPVFYFKHEYDGDAEQIEISATRLSGYMPSPIHVDDDGDVHDKAYIAAYNMALVDNKPTSRSGVFSTIYSVNTAMTDARKAGADFTCSTTAERYTMSLLMFVEFATRNMQNVMQGAASMAYAATYTATAAGTATNQFTTTKAIATKFVVGQSVGIGTSLGGTQVANNRIITDISGGVITFDGDPVNIAVGNIIWTTAWKNGACDGVLSSSGSPVSNSNGKYPCMYRGIENPYGNAFEQIADVLFKREGTGTEEDPYTYDIYFLPDARKYAAGAITDDYVKLNYQIPAADGYAKKFGIDARYPFARLPVSIGASTTTYYSDYYYAPRSALCAAHVGGYWYFGPYDGPSYWRCGGTPSISAVDYRARLSKHRKSGGTGAAIPVAPAADGTYTLKVTVSDGVATYSWEA